MIPRVSLASALAVASLALASAAPAAIVLTGGAAVTATAADFVRTPAGAGTLTPPVSTSAAGGSYAFSNVTLDNGTVASGFATVASAMTATPSAAITITNNTGVIIPTITLSGFVVQFKDNSSNNVETLVASKTGGGAVPDATLLSFQNVLNVADSKSTVNDPPLSAAYTRTLTGVNLGVGQSLTITWTDAKDGATNALFGLGNLTARAIVPEPAGLSLLGVSGLSLLRRRRA